ncbi:hypothetical protein AB3318_001568 [Escherichia coli]|uniref:hypothetical protein n=1 Tax=Escherichia coli TaxID=562 RepID=UPI0002A3F3B8|nr:hypothetical protein [Escherichia coli]ELE53542.1 hypothetical protein A1UM_03491 [Escherichia coli KTE75]
MTIQGAPPFVSWHNYQAITFFIVASAILRFALSSVSYSTKALKSALVQYQPVNAVSYPAQN